MNDEPDDYRLLKDMIRALVVDERGFSGVRKGALDVLAARETFFSEMLKAVQGNTYVPEHD